MKRIIVTSYADAKRFRPAPGERYAVLSFADTGAPPKTMPRHIGFVSRLVIDADDALPGEDERFSPLTTAHAARIADFVIKCGGNIDTLLVHCLMGMSRSPAAALAIADALAIDAIEIRSQDAIPNRHFRELIFKALQSRLGL